MDNNDEDNIRAPEPVKMERLINDDYQTINENNRK